MVGPILVIIFSFIATTSYRYITEEKEKKWVRKAFSHYLSPKVMEEILTDPSKLGLGGKRENLTVLFSDIRGFTSYCEKRAPEDIIPILNEYLDVMSNVILKYNGTLDKYVGDEIVAFFGAPAMKQPLNHAEMAVRTSLEMVAELKKLHEKWKSEGKEPLDFGVGINTGPMMVGNMGSTNRLNYTVIGDEVNLGARVEALTRDYNVRIIITQSTYDNVKDMVEVKRLGEVMVKGKAQPVIVYELLSLKAQP
jgi:adenylate cyclase